MIDDATRRFFIPKTETRLYRWPQRQPGSTAYGTSYVLWLDQGLISVTTLQTKAQDTSPTTVAATDYFLEPANQGPPYDRVEIDLSSTASFESGDTPQRSISIAGSWGYTATTRSGGTVSSGLASDATATSFVSSSGVLVEVGHTLLIESEQVFVSGVTNAAEPNNDLLNGALTKDMSVTTVTVDDGTRYTVGEVILVEAEKMLIESISGNNLTVERGHDGTEVAAHIDDTAVQVNRTFTIERGVNGTTAATHANATAVSVYEVPFDVNTLAIAEAIAAIAQESSGWGRIVGTGEGGTELSGRTLSDFRKRVVDQYKRTRIAKI